LLTGHLGLFFMGVVAIFGFLFIAAGRMVHSSHKKRSSRQQL
jgi:hypothetical protein